MKSQNLTGRILIDLISQMQGCLKTLNSEVKAALKNLFLILKIIRKIKTTSTITTIIMTTTTRKTDIHLLLHRTEYEKIFDINSSVALCKPVHSLPCTSNRPGKVF